MTTHTLPKTGWSPQRHRADPVAILAAQGATRLPELLGQMLISHLTSGPAA